MSAKVTIYLGQELKALVDKNESLSGRVNSIASRYSCIMRESTPTLTRGEWAALCDVLNGTVLDTGAGGAHDPARHIDLQVYDAGRLEGLGTKWGIDAGGLSHRIAQMSFAEQCAIIEVARRFWTIPNSGNLTRQLKSAGAEFDFPLQTLEIVRSSGTEISDASNTGFIPNETPSSLGIDDDDLQDGDYYYDPTGAQTGSGPSAYSNLFLDTRGYASATYYPTAFVLLGLLDQGFTRENVHYVASDLDDCYNWAIENFEDDYAILREDRNYTRFDDALADLVERGGAMIYFPASSDSPKDKWMCRDAEVIGEMTEVGYKESTRSALVSAGMTEKQVNEIMVSML